MESDVACALVWNEAMDSVEDDEEGQMVVERKDVSALPECVTLCLRVTLRDATRLFVYLPTGRTPNASPRGECTLWQFLNVIS